MLKYEQAPMQTTPYRKPFNHNYTSNSVIDKANGRWPSILESLGINASYLTSKHGPCPVCGGKDRFRFDDKEGRGTFICNQCGAGAGVKLLQLYHGWDFETAIRQLGGVLGVQTGLCVPTHIKVILNKQPVAQEACRGERVEVRQKKLQNVWRCSSSIIKGGSVDCYLQSRGIKLNDFPCVLRFHPALPYYDDGKLVDNFPALVALVQNIKGQLVTLHRTYLGDACKADVKTPKKLMPSITPGASNGAAIRLHEPCNGKLALAEGIETAFAVHVATHLPVWATVSAHGMERVVLPPYVTEVTIAIDNDASNTGQKAATKLRERLLAEGRKVRCVIPPHIGCDFADLLVGKN